MESEGGVKQRLRERVWSQGGGNAGGNIAAGSTITASVVSLNCYFICWSPRLLAGTGSKAIAAMALTILRSK